MWNFLSHARDTGAEILCIQEHNMGIDEMQNFARSAASSGWCCYYTLGRSCGRLGPDARTGGTLTLVDKSLKSRQAWELVQDGGQCVGVVVGSVLVLNAYMAHHATRPAFLSDMFDFCQTVDNHTWLLVAD